MSLFIGFFVHPENGYMLRSTIQAMQDIKSHQDGSLRSPFGMVSPSVTQSGVHPQRLQRVDGCHQFVDVHKLARTINNMIPIV